MGEATISGSAVDSSPVSTKHSYTESEDGESPSKSYRASWEVLDREADGVIKSLNEQLTAIAERAESNSPQSENERELPSYKALKRSGSSDSEGTTIWTGDTGLDALDVEEAVDVEALGCHGDEQLSVDKKCLVGHELKPHRTPSDRWWCSKCLRQVPEGTRLFGCRICNYDECWSCLSAAQAQVKQEQPRCEPCSVVTSTAPQEVLVQEVALLQQQMQVLKDQLSGVTKERDDAIVKNQKLENHVSRMWKAALA